LRSFIGIVNYYGDMWVKRSHVLAPLATLTSNKKKWDWGPQQDVAFNMAKKIIASEMAILRFGTKDVGGDTPPTEVNPDRRTSGANYQFNYGGTW
jgi:hypothetical protein